MYAQVEKFLVGVIGGRYQETMAPEVQQQLAKLTVDVATVTVKKKVNVSSASSLPAVRDAWSAETSEYNMSLSVQGQNVPMSMKRTISPSGATWTARDEVSGAQGLIKDEVAYNSDGTIVSRSIEQMGQSMSMTFVPAKATVSMAGKNMDMSLPASYFCDAPGCDKILAKWPLAAGFKIVTDIPDMMTMR
jgi:hypothetical protein